MTICTCGTHLIDGMPTTMHQLCCVYFRIPSLANALDKLAEKDAVETHLMRREARLRQSEGCLRFHARKVHA